MCALSFKRSSDWWVWLHGYMAKVGLNKVKDGEDEGTRMEAALTNESDLDFP